MTTDAYLTTCQLAKRWCFHPESIRRMLREGKLPAIRMGKRVLRVSMEAVLAYKEARKLDRPAVA